MASLIKIERSKEFLRKAVWVLAEKAFLTFLSLFFLALIFGAFLFYKNVILAKKIRPEALERPLQFNEGLLRKILSEQENRKVKFEETEKKQYPDPFRSGTPPKEESLE